MGDYDAELNNIKLVYQEIPIEGRCLDVGGHQGRLRAFLDSEQEYVSCDPFISVFDGVTEDFELTQAYPCLLEPINFLACDAEFLPFQSCVFDVVHMRSVLDHFLNPEQALNEAYRTLMTNGTLVIGLYVYGGKYGKPGIKRSVKDTIKSILPYFGIHRYTDPHTWHPTYKELINLISQCGFEIDKVHWQTGHNDTVCYIKALKKKNGLLKLT